MEPDEQSDELRDRHTFAVADHGVDPADMPSPLLAVARASGMPGVSSSPGSSSSDASSSGGSSTPSASSSNTPGASRRSRRPRKPSRGDDSFGLKDIAIWCGIPALIVILLNIFLVGFYEIPSGSMRDTIEVGDRVVTSRLSPRFTPLKRGDVVVFHDPAGWLSNEQTNPLKGDYLIKRLIGLPGDTVACAGAGQPITVNGVPLDESAYLKPGVAPSAFPFSVTVSSGNLFVLGDNRANSADSRYHADDGENGLVPESKVVGVAIARYWPLNRIGLIASHHEVFSQVPSPSAAGQPGASGSSGGSTDGVMTSARRA